MISVNINKGDIFEIVLEDLAFGGDCVGRLENDMVVFVPGGVPGERVKVKITQIKKSFARAELVDIIESSQNRIQTDCNRIDNCGGCQLQHLEYQTQLYYKRKIVQDSLEKIAKIDNVKVNKVIGNEYPWQYRNKARFAFTRSENDNLQLGFYREGTNEVVINNNCSILHPLINRIERETLQVINNYDLTLYNEKIDKGLLRNLLIRVGVCTNQALAVFITSDEQFPEIDQIAEKIINKVPELKGVLQNIKTKNTKQNLGQKTRLIRGDNKYIDYIGTVKFEISPESFFQVNTLQTKKLYDCIMEFGEFTGKEIVVDGYCGIGTISLYIAEKVKKVYGIELKTKAVKDAQNNARINNINNCSFIQGKVNKGLSQLKNKGVNSDLIILDPPRRGLSKSLRKTILEYSPEKIIYISCNPSTLARDLKQLKNNYQVDIIQPVDMFPQTYHIESITILDKKI